MSAFALKVRAASSTQHWQLALDKFPFPGAGGPALPERKIDSLKPLTNATRYARDWHSAIRSHQGFLATLERQHGPRFRRISLVNASRLLLHLGRASVLENVGLYCDRTTGLPVIPGTAIKGVVSTWACWESHFVDADGSFQVFTDTSVQRSSFADPELARAILGDNASSGSTAAGVITFAGAWPAMLPVLGLDIVTPHHDASGRDRDPSPNPFLCIEPGTEWHFGLLASPRQEAPDRFLDTAERWLRESLEQSGLGAKTAAGYGRFTSPEVWKAATLSAAQLAKDEADAARAAERAAQIEEWKKSQLGDYTDITFKGAVLDLLDQPGQYQKLQTEIRRLRDNPANAPWIASLTDALRGKEKRDVRKRLKDKEWFPTEWLPL